MSQSSDDRTMQPTPRRRLEAAREGRVARSRALSSALVIVGGLAVLSMFGERVVSVIRKQLQSHLGNSESLAVDGEKMAAQWQQTIMEVLAALLPVLGGFLVVAILANLAQTGIQFLPGNVAPRMNRISPGTGLKRMLSAANLASVVFGLAQLVVAGAIVWWCFRSDLPEILTLGTLATAKIASAIGTILFSLSMKLGMGLFAIAVLDYAYRRWQHERELRMTPQEVREESRLVEGDPHLAGRRRQLGARIAHNSNDMAERVELP